MKNMAITDLVLVRPRSFPHAESNALAAGADDILAGARVVSTVSEAVADCGFIAGTTSRPRSYYWEFTTPRDVAARIVALPGEIALRCCSARSATVWLPTTCSIAMCWSAYPRTPGLLLAEPCDVGSAIEL